MTPQPEDPPIARSAPDASSTSSTHPPPPPARVCLHCGAAGAKLQRCGGCRRVYFCDRDCQVRVWRQHRPQCLTITTPASSSSSAPSSSTANAPTTSTPSTDWSAQASPPPAVARAPAVTIEEPRPVTSSPALHPRRSASPKSVRLAPEPVEVLELPTASSSSPTKKSKKSKHRKKQAPKARSQSLHAPASAPLPARDAKQRAASFCARKRVAWGDVRAREFARFPGGGGAVPYDGTWALGLGDAVGDVALGPVLAVEAQRAEALAARARELPRREQARALASQETRQFDYRRGAANPLFARLSERERKQLFVGGAERHVATHADGAGKSRKKGARESVGHHGTSHHGTGTHQRTRRASEPQDDDDTAEPDLDAPDFACVSVEQLDEFARIRDSRDAACGCACGELVKKVGKMHVKRLLAFLAERGVAPPAGAGKPALLALARDVAARERNCANARDCECARNGVGCHANACAGCAGDCHNPFDAYAYDKAAVAQYRKQALARWREEAAASAQEPVSVS